MQAKKEICDMNLNWYKMAQKQQMQQTFDFYNDPAYQWSDARTDPYFKDWAKEKGLNPDLLSELLQSSGASNIFEVKSLLNQFGFKWEELQLKDNLLILVSFGDDNYVIDDFDDPELSQAEKWLSEIWDHNLYSYVDYADFHKDFWDGVGDGFHLYHATDPENKEEILKHGLQQMSKTRAINNRNMGSAVFTSENPDSIGSYGSLIFSIDVGAMKRDGYMPTVSMEEPFEDVKAREALAWKLGIQDTNYSSEYASEGLYEDTVAFYGDIPPKYLSIYQE